MQEKQQAQSSLSFIESVNRAELSSIDKILARAMQLTDITDYALTDKQLDRELATAVAAQEFVEGLSAADIEGLMTAADLVHEASRARRDVQVATATHKQLMLGCYKTLYQRKRMLENKIQEATYA